ncbi:hypothetical protein FC48_GL001805 [Ligilactobacillus murinus DSM 20452 = NBRC 14221]|uniref:Uncharacterized protein n=1 Tax=Ligilactobacillus murinus DSM 20452 = NBRC 14221 TaxID=1423772 RepID=A0A0R2B346_9LACO|nr:hypothetical protein [Ligilactobacillus murinus]KRM70278.1 hypothetical protein FC48_GL001805 [Ligilactobacillus murinus DSM 20452 = NBRC 14221]MCR1879952.1 hypothetical protein [Ligilactobacillus murinus]HAB50303.1 hypothetical protein [Lactobacillus sp.]HAP23664.1 hypothetical protein [Lactobacillus sp.]
MKKQKLHERMQSKFHNFKNEQKQKYDLSKRYFASDEEMNEEEFAAKEKLFFLDMLKLVAYLSIFVVLYFLFFR